MSIRQYFFIVLIFLSLLQAEEKIFSNSLLFSADQKQYSLSSSTEAEESLFQALSDIKFDSSKDHLVILIHGRGKHPQKLFKKKILKKLQDSYKIKVLAFNWSPSWDGPLGWEKPKQGAFASSERLFFVLSALERYQKLHPNLVASLITHSMGSLVLQSFGENYPRRISTSLFKNVVISASASPLKNHAKWVNKIKMQENLYIVINEQDLVLSAAGSSLFSARLGRKLKKFLGGYEKLAKNAAYIDVSKLNVNHGYYINNSGYLRNFYSIILNGKNVLSSKNNGLVKQKEKEIYSMQK